MLRYTMVNIMKMKACRVMTRMWNAVQTKPEMNCNGAIT